MPPKKLSQQENRDRLKKLAEAKLAQQKEKHDKEMEEHQKLHAGMIDKLKKKEKKEESIRAEMYLLAANFDWVVRDIVTRIRNARISTNDHSINAGSSGTWGGSENPVRCEAGVLQYSRYGIYHDNSLSTTSKLRIPHEGFPDIFVHLA